MSRVYEALIVLVLVGLLVIGIVWVVDSITRTELPDNSSIVVSNTSLQIFQDWNGLLMWMVVCLCDLVTYI